MALLYTAPALSQGETYHWFLPTNQHYTVTPAGPARQADVNTEVHALSSSISDSTGRLLFFTASSPQGDYAIYDRDYKELPYFISHPLGNLHGDPIFIRNPADPLEYFFFYSSNDYHPDNPQYNSVKYGLVDMRLNNGKGDLVKLDVTLDSSISNSFVPVKKNDNDFWIVTNRASDKKFNAWLFSSGGVAAAPVTSDRDANEPAREDFIYGLKASPDGKMIAGIVMYSTGEFPNTKPVRYAEVFNADAQTGILTYKVKIPENAFYSNYNSFSALEFSPDNRLLYVIWQMDMYLLQSCDYSACNVTQYNLCYTDSIQIAQYASVVKSVFNLCSNGEFYTSPQLAADKKIYTPYDNNMSIGLIATPNHIGVTCGFTETAPGIEKQTSLNHLSSFYHDYINKSVQNNILYAGGCYKSPLRFSISNSNIISAHWNFGDVASGFANTSNLLNPSHTFTAPGIYTVTSVLYDGKGNTIETLTDQLEVKDPAVRLLTGWPKDTTLCGFDTFRIKMPPVINAIHYWKFRYEGTHNYISLGTSENMLIGVQGSGTYVLELHQNDCDGCVISDSLAFHMITSPSFSLGADRALCGGDSLHLIAYTEGADIMWNTGQDTNNIWVTKPGQYWASAEYDHNGCVAHDTINLTASPGINFSLGNDTTLCNDETLVLKPNVHPANYFWNNYTYADTLLVKQSGTYWAWLSNSAGRSARDTIQVSYVNADEVSLGADTSLCKGESLTLSANVPSATYLWNTGSSAGGITVNKDGNYWVKVSNGSCTVADTISVMFHDLPPVSLGSDTALCDGEKLLLSVAIPNGIYTWEDGSTQNTHEITGAGSYWVQVNEQGCVAADTVKISYKPLPQVWLGNDTTLCEKQVLRLNEATAGIQSYQWQDGTTASFYTIASPGSYSLTVLGNGCYNADTVTVNYTIIPTFSLGSDTTLCDLQTMTLSSPGNGLTSKWQDGIVAPSYTVSMPGWYWLEVSDKGCRRRDSILVTYQASPHISLGNDTAVCQDTPVMLNAFSAGSTYMWQDGSDASTYAVIKSGLYSVAVALNGCIQKDTITVSYIGKPVFSLGKDTTLCTGTQFTLRPLVSDAIAYQWQDGSTLLYYIVGEPGTYRVNIAGQCGTSADDIVVKNGICRMSVPSAFTPDQDGHNDRFKALYDGRLSQFHMSVYNRWGKLIFTSSDIHNGWDGTVNGFSLSTDTYIWTLSFTAVDGISHQMQGTVVLLR